MRRLGYRVIDALVEHWSTLDAAPPVAIGDAAALREALGGPPPDGPGDPDAALERLLGEVVPWTARNIHPRWFARIGSPSNYVSALADAIASGFNLLGTSWVASSGPSTVELTVLDWLREWCGMPPGTEGLLTSGGSMASLTALVAAREARGGGGVVYLSDQAHASILRDLRVMGEREVRVLRATPRSACRLRGRRRRGGGPGGRPAAVRGRRQRGDHQHGRGRPSGRARGSVRGRGALVPRRRGVRGGGGADASRAARRWRGSTGATPWSSTRTSGSSSPTRQAPC